MLQTAGAKASAAKSMIAENIMPGLGSFMGKAKESLGAAGAAAQNAYKSKMGGARNNNSEAQQQAYADGDDYDDDEFTPMPSAPVRSSTMTTNQYHNPLGAASNNSFNASNMSN